MSDIRESQPGVLTNKNPRGKQLVKGEFENLILLFLRGGRHIRATNKPGVKIFVCRETGFSKNRHDKKWDHTLSSG